MISKIHLFYSVFLKSILTLFIVFVTAVFYSSCEKTTEPKTSEDEFEAEIDAFVSGHMNPEGSGFAIMVIKDGNIAFAQGWGMANIAAGVPFISDTPCQLASLSKQFTAIAILILYERGLLNMDTSIGEHFRDFPVTWADITVHQLLTHQSGIPNFTDLTPDGVAGFDGLTNDGALDLVLKNYTLEFPPGEQAQYSNTGYLILAMLVEHITEMTYSDFLEETIFGPLEMNNTFVRDETVVYPQDTALPYNENNVLYEYDCYTYGPTGIYSTLNDLFKWDQALYSNQIVGQSTLQLAFTGYTGGDNNFGYGWMVSSYRGLPSYRHGGFSLGFLNYIFRVPGKHFMYLMLSNGGVFANNGFDTWTNDLMDKIFAYYL